MPIVWKFLCAAVELPFIIAVALVVAVGFVVLLAVEAYLFAELQTLFGGDKHAQARAWSR